MDDFESMAIVDDAIFDDEVDRMAVFDPDHWIAIEDRYIGEFSCFDRA